MINFNTEKLIIFYYPPYAGGKFLINSLGLSDFSLFQSSEFATKQLEGNFSKLDKINYLTNKIKETKDWNDLSLGCLKLFGYASFGVFSLKLVNLTDDTKNYFEFLDIIETITHRNYYFFLVCHNPTELAKAMNFWPNAKVVEFLNFNSFQEKYRKVKDHDYNILKGSSWPDNFPSIQEYLNLDLDIQNDIAQHYPGFKYFQDNPNHVERIIYNWNTENYLSYEQTLKHFKELCLVLNLNDIDFEDFELYYKSWIDKLSELSKNYK